MEKTITEYAILVVGLFALYMFLRKADMSPTVATPDAPQAEDAYANMAPYYLIHNLPAGISALPNPAGGNENTTISQSIQNGTVVANGMDLITSLSENLEPLIGNIISGTPTGNFIF